MHIKIPPGALVESIPGCDPRLGDQAIPHDWRLITHSQDGTQFYKCKRCSAMKQVRVGPKSHP